MDTKEILVSKGPKFPFSYIRSMAVTPDGSFYNPENAFSKNKQDFENMDFKQIHNEQKEILANNLIHNKADLIFTSHRHFNEKNNDFEEKLIHEQNKLSYDKSTKNIKNKDLKVDNLKKFQSKINDSEINQYIYENRNAKRIKTAGHNQPKKYNLNLNFQTDSKNLYEMQNNCSKEYERLIKTSKNSRRIENFPISKIINKRMQKSDIFFLENRNPNTQNNNFDEMSEYSVPALNKPDYSNSDIFSLRNNENSMRKLGEKHLLFENKYKLLGFYPGADSNSAWSPKTPFKSLINNSSSGYDIINPCMKKTNYCNNNPIMSDVNYANPVHRQKGLTEFVDLTRNFVPNYNKDFLNAVSKDPKIFSKNQDLCANFLNLHGEYKSICDRPFIKKIY